MKDYIEQFIWGYQQHFRWKVAYEVQRAFESVGSSLDVQVMLVALAENDDRANSICIEPEDGPLAPTRFLQVPERASEIYAANPKSSLLYSHPEHHRRMHAGLRRAANSEAVREIIDQSSVSDDYCYFVSNSAIINEYVVHTCIGVQNDPFNALPKTTYRDTDGVVQVASLQHSIVTECLRRADDALYQPDPGSSYSILGNTQDLVVSAADNLVSALIYHSGGVPFDLNRIIQSCSAHEYEQRSARGRIVICKNDHPCLDPVVHLEESVNLGDVPAMRLLLETAGSSLTILANGNEAYSLGTHRSADGLLEVDIAGKLYWRLSTNEVCLFEFRDGRPILPESVLDPVRFADTSSRIVGAIDHAYFLDLIHQAQESGGGMTIVISEDPQFELERLGSESLTLKPVRLEPLYAMQLGAVDGAVFFDGTGACHAFGVILDGTADGHGDRARGSRFNSAIRYQRTRARDALLVVISSDGAIDIIPSLMPRVDQSDVRSAVDDFCSLAEDPNVDGEDFSRAYDRALRLAFYLDSDQCDRINQAWEQEMDRRFEQGIPVLRRPPLRSNPEMNNEYFLS